MQAVPLAMALEDEFIRDAGLAGVEPLVLVNEDVGVEEGLNAHSSHPV